MRRILISVSGAVLCLAIATPGGATQVSQPMNVSLTIGAAGGQVSLAVGSLVLVGPSPLVQGTASGTGILHVTATSGLSYMISLDQGLHAFTTRNIAGPANVPYYLYQDAAHTVLWGSAAFLGLGSAVNGVGTGSDQPYTVYGLTGLYGGVGSTTPTPNGTYTDVVTVAVDF